MKYLPMVNSCDPCRASGWLLGLLFETNRGKSCWSSPSIKAAGVSGGVVEGDEAPKQPVSARSGGVGIGYGDKQVLVVITTHRMVKRPNR